MKKRINILLWVGFFIGTIVMLSFSQSKQNTKICSKLIINVDTETGMHFINEDDKEDVEEDVKEDVKEDDIKEEVIDFGPDGTDSVYVSDHKHFLKNLVITDDLGDIQDLSSKTEYKKMSTNKLREVVVSKGIITDASKLKKQEILKLLGDE